MIFHGALSMIWRIRKNIYKTGEHFKFECQNMLKQNFTRNVNFPMFHLLLIEHPWAYQFFFLSIIIRLLPTLIFRDYFKILSEHIEYIHLYWFYNEVSIFFYQLIILQSEILLQCIKYLKLKYQGNFIYLVLKRGNFFWFST